MKKVLMNASVASMIYRFNMGNIDILEKMGYKVEVACNFSKKENPIKEEEIEAFKAILKDKGVTFYETDCPRSVFSLKKMIKTHRQLKSIIKRENYEIVHTQSPIGGVICRLAARKARQNGTKVIYTAHGFHFYKGAPIKNWIIYYTVEKICARLTDILITINKEDYLVAQQKMKSKRVEYIPGVGIDVDKYVTTAVDINRKRQEINVPDNVFLILSVGELNSNKNHEVIVRAIAKLNKKDIHFAIAGQGNLQTHLRELASELGVENQVHLLGVRSDVAELYCCADVCSFTSIREGLGLAAIEGMASGLPLVVADNRGSKDYAENEKNAFVCKYNDVDAFANAIDILYYKADIRKVFGEENRKRAMKYDKKNVDTMMKEIYKTCVI